MIRFDKENEVDLEHCTAVHVGFFLADQSQATDERVALVQPVTVKEAEELNAACKEAREVLDETSNI